MPKYLLLENVKNLVGKRFKPAFDEWCDYLNSIGYNTYWKVINSKDCGIPQNRERIFALSIRKDIDTGHFSFPKPFDTGIRLMHIIDSVRDDKYVLKSEAADKALNEMNDNGTLDEEEQIWQEMFSQRDRYPNYGIIKNPPLTNSTANINHTLMGGVLPLNDQNGNARTLKSQYSKTAIQNIQSQGTFGATGVIQWQTKSKSQQ